MLNLNHPQTPHIFRASAHLDRVLEFCKDLTLIPGPARLGRLTAVADEFRALHELNRAYFGASPEIEVNIDRFKDAVERIAALPMCEVVGQSGVCPACGKSLTITRKRARPLGRVVEPRIEVPAAVMRRPGIPANPPVLSDSVEQARYCSPCLEILTPSFESLSRHEGGFGTWAI